MTGRTVGVTVALVLVCLVGGCSKPEPTPAVDPPRAVEPEVAPKVVFKLPSPPRKLSETADETEFLTWRRLGCFVCHGLDGTGTPMGPPVASSVLAYLRESPTPQEAQEALARYLIAPGKVKPRRPEDVKYPTLMESIKAKGGSEDDAQRLAGMLLGLVR